jgi:hypothetical protein
MSRFGGVPARRRRKPGRRSRFVSLWVRLIAFRTVEFAVGCAFAFRTGGLVAIRPFAFRFSIACGFGRASLIPAFAGLGALAARARIGLWVAPRAPIRAGRGPRSPVCGLALAQAGDLRAQLAEFGAELADFGGEVRVVGGSRLAWPAHRPERRVGATGTGGEPGELAALDASGQVMEVVGHVAEAGQGEVFGGLVEVAGAGVAVGFRLRAVALRFGCVGLCSGSAADRGESALYWRAEVRVSFGELAQFAHRLLGAFAFAAGLRLFELPEEFAHRFGSGGGVARFGSGSRVAFLGECEGCGCNQGERHRNGFQFRRFHCIGTGLVGFVPGRAARAHLGRYSH